VSVGEPSQKKRNWGIAITGHGATTLPAKGIAQNCLILIFATTVAVATPSVSPATNSGDGFNK